jgi:hypothetical protein
VQRTRRTVTLEADEVARADYVWATPWLTVLEQRADGGTLPAAWSLELASALADLPGVTLLSRLVPVFYGAVALLRALVVVEGRVDAARVPNPVRAPCSVHAEDAEIRFPWAAWATAWPRLREELRGSPLPFSLIAKRAVDARLGGLEVAIVDVQAPAGWERSVDALVDAVCGHGLPCVGHVGKSLSQALATATFDGYYASVPRDGLALDPCLHPHCARDGVPRAYASVRGGPTPWWQLR